MDGEVSSGSSTLPVRSQRVWYSWVASYARAAGLEPGPDPCRIDRARRTLHLDGRPVWESDRVDRLQAVAEWYVMADWAGELARRLVVCHAAALEWQGGALLLVGPSGSGKSTLAAALACRGFGFLGDEFVLLRPEPLVALPFPKAICLKSPAAEQLAPATTPYFEVLEYPPGFAPRYEGAICCRPRPGGVPAAGGGCPVRWVILLGGEGGAGAEQLASSAIVRDIYAAFWLRSEAAFRVAAALARQASVAVMPRRDLEHMVAAVVDLVTPQLVRTA